MPNQHEAVVKAAILCGGEGKRLRPLTQFFQKTMIPVGPKMRPLLEFVVRLMVYHGIPDIVLLSGYKGEEIERYFGDGARFGARISYSRDTTEVGGSARALMQAIADGTLGKFDELIVYYGDVLSALDVGAVLAKHLSSGADMTLVLSKNYYVPVGVAQVKGERVVGFREKPNLGLDVTMGCLAMSNSCVKILRQVTARGQKSDIMANLVPKVIESGKKVSPFYLDSFWYDIGSTEAYERLDDATIGKNVGFLD